MKRPKTPLALLIVAISLTVGLVCHRALTPSRDAHDLAVVRARAQSVPQPAPVAAAPPTPAPPPVAPAPAPTVLVRTPPTVAVPPPRAVPPAAAPAMQPRPGPVRAPAPDATTALRPYFAAWDSLGDLVTALARDRTEDLKLTVGQLERASVLLTERIEADAIERKALLDALDHVTRMSAAVAERIDPARRVAQPPSQRVVAAPPAVVAPPPPVVESRAPERAPAPLPRAEPAAQRKNGDAPAVGIEIADSVSGADGMRYWLRRKSDGYIFPRTFAAPEIPFLLESVDPSPAAPATP